MDVDFPTFVIQFARNCGAAYICPFGNCGEIFATEDDMTRHLGRTELEGGHETELRNRYNNLNEILIRARGIGPAISYNLGASIEHSEEESGNSVGMSEGDDSPCSSAHRKREAIAMKLVWPKEQGFKRSRYSKNVVKEPTMTIVSHMDPTPKLPEPIESLVSSDPVCISGGDDPPRSSVHRNCKTSYAEKGKAIALEMEPTPNVPTANERLEPCMILPQQYAQVPQAQPWFYTITHENVNTGAMYDPSSKKWHHPTNPSLPTKEIVLPVASAGGLVCFLDIGHRNFYVCNPLTQSFKELPARSVKVWSRVAVGMTLNGNSTSGGYKILWVGCDGEYEVYDSGKNSWTRPGSMPISIKLPLSLNFRSQAVSIDNKLYFMRSDPEGIVSYDMVTGVWKQFIIPAPPHLTDHTLAECEGRIMLMGLLTKNAATCVCIWELQKMTLVWEEVDRMPNIWCLEFYGKHVRMTCLGNKGLLMLSMRSRQMNRLVTYNVLSREWVKVPGCLLPCGRKRQWIACGTAFHPCPTAWTSVEQGY